MIEQLSIEEFFYSKVIENSILSIVKYIKLERGVFLGEKEIVINIIQNIVFYSQR